MKRAKDEVRQVLDRLPDDCTMDDIRYALHVRTAIRRGLWSLENEPTYTQEEVEQRRRPVARDLIGANERGAIVRFGCAPVALNGIAGLLHARHPCHAASGLK